MYVYNNLQICLSGGYVKLLDKVVFLENRRFLPKNHELRHKEAQDFPSGKTETRNPPEKVTNDDILWNSVAHTKAKNKTQASNVMKATGSKGVNCFMLLPDNDVMHNLKNVITAFVDLFTGKSFNYKVKDAEVELGRFKNCFGGIDDAGTKKGGQIVS